MKKLLLSGITALLASSLIAAESAPKETGPKEAVTKAAKALGEKASYSWKSTVTVPEGAGFRPGPTEGKTEKDGLTHVTMSFGDNTSEFVMKGEKGVAKTPEDGWQTLAELENSEGMGRFLGMIARNTKTPVVQVSELAAAAKELKKDGDSYSGDLTEDGAKKLMSFRMGGADGPAISDAKGSVKFWLKEGLPSKYEFQVKGKMNWNGNDVDVDRTTTVEIKDVGTTKLSVPEEAKKKLS